MRSRKPSQKQELSTILSHKLETTNAQPPLSKGQMETSPHVHSPSTKARNGVTFLSTLFRGGMNPTPSG